MNPKPVKTKRPVNDEATQLLLQQISHTQPTINLCRWLLEQGADVDSCNKESSYPPLMSAIRRGQVELAQLLLEYGASANKTSNNRVAPLIYAINNNHPKMIPLLIEYGANIEAKDSQGSTALLIAAGSYNDKKCHIINALLESGANVNAQDNLGQTALMKTIIYDSWNALHTILRYTPNINIQDNRGNTALIYAVNAGCVDIVQMLLEKGADTQITNKNGATARDIAIEYNSQYSHPDIAAMIDTEEKRRIIKAFQSAAESGTPKTRKIVRRTHKKTSP
ncbi:MAG: ankyrin repeat domain-containing protein [Alphaproteobacteria bacterium]|nr:ankyrin repeat domain-containing protein [Alphaproteobacteria bacterium]